MTDTPSTLDAGSGWVDARLSRLIDKARRTGRLTQHDLVRALPEVELTGDVLAAILHRCAEAGIVLNGARPRDALLSAKGGAETELLHIDAQMAERAGVEQELASCNETRRVAGTLALELGICPALFRRQMSWLAANRRVVSSEDAVTRLRRAGLAGVAGEAVVGGVAARARVEVALGGDGVRPRARGQIELLLGAADEVFEHAEKQHRDAHGEVFPL